MEGFKSMFSNLTETRILLMENYLQSLGERKLFGVGDAVRTLHGPHALKEARVVEVKDNDMVVIAIPSDSDRITEINQNDLYHSADYYKAFETALREEPRESQKPS